MGAASRALQRRSPPASPREKAYDGLSAGLSSLRSAVTRFSKIIFNLIAPTDVQLELADLSQGELAFVFLRPLAS